MTSKDDLIAVAVVLVVLALWWLAPGAVQAMYGF